MLPLQTFQTHLDAFLCSRWLCLTGRSPFQPKRFGDSVKTHFPAAATPERHPIQSGREPRRGEALHTAGCPAPLRDFPAARSAGHPEGTAGLSAWTP